MGAARIGAEHRTSTMDCKNGSCERDYANVGCLHLRLLRYTKRNKDSWVIEYNRDSFRIQSHMKGLNGSDVKRTPLWIKFRPIYTC